MSVSRGSENRSQSFERNLRGGKLGSSAWRRLVGRSARFRVISAGREQGLPKSWDLDGETVFDPSVGRELFSGAWEQLSARFFGVLEIETHDSEIGTIVGGRDRWRPTDGVVPHTGNSRGFVNMTVQREPWLMRFDESAHSDATNVRINGHAIVRAPIQTGTIEPGAVGRGVRQEHGAGWVQLSK